MKRIFAAFIAAIMILAVFPVLAASDTLQAFADSITAESITQNELSDFVTKDLVLPVAPDGVTVTWVSSDETAITNDGKVTRTDIVDKPVTMIATITDGTDTITKEVSLNVVANATNVFYQNNFHYPELVGINNVISSIGWVDQTNSGMEHSIRTDENGNHYIYMDHAGAKYPQAGPSLSAQGSKITIQMDISIDFSMGTGKYVDLWLGMERGSSIDYPTIRITPGANGALSVGGMTTVPGTGREPLIIELDMENLTMRAKSTGDWSSSKDIPSKNEAWTGLKYVLFRRGSGGSPAGVVEVDNLILYEARDRASYADYLDAEKTIAVLDAAKMTDDVNLVKTNLNLNYAELAAANTANGTTVTLESSNPDIISIENGVGVVNRPYDNTEVTITATVSKGSYSKQIKLKFIVCANDAINDTLSALAFKNMSDESNFAVTKDIDLSYSELTQAMHKYGTTVVFESSNPDVLTISGGKGIITRGETVGEATLTATVSIADVTRTIEYKIYVPAANTYVITADDFNYPEYKDKFVNGVARWSTQELTDRMHAKLREENGDYFIEAGIDTVSGGHHLFSYDHVQERATKAISVEMTLTYLETCTTPHYYFEAYCEKNKLSRVAMTGTSVSVQDYSNTAKATGTRAKKGDSDRIKYVFDFENQCYDFYLNGTKLNAEPIAFEDGKVSDGLTRLEFSGYRNDAGAKYRIDDFVIYAENPEFTQDYVSEAGQPLQVSVSYSETKYSDPVNITIVSEFDNENDLSQVFKIVNADSAITNNCHYDYHEAHLINKESGAKSALVGYPQADESAPPHMNGTYLGANHGASEGVEVTATAHGKTNGDLGSVWVDSAGVQWTLIRVIDENTILFLSEAERNETTGNWKFADTITGTTLTYDASVSDNFAVNTDAITSITVKATSVQVFPSIGNRVIKMHVVRDGEITTYENMDTVREGFKINGSKVILEETYDVIDPTLIGENMRASRPDGGYTSMADISVGDPIMKYKQTITIYEDGDVIIDLDHELLKKVYSFQYYGYQYYKRADAFGGGLYRYMPGLTKYTSGGKEYDFSIPVLMPVSNETNASSDLIPSSFTATSSYWANDIVPDRVIEYYKDAEGEYKMAFASGFVPIYDAAPDVRGENVTQTLYMLDRIGHKVYPMLANGNNYKEAGSKIRGVAFRHYDALDQSTKKVTAYDVEYKDDVYYYVDFLEDEENFVLDLDKKTVTDDYELVYKTDDVEYEIVGNKLIVSGKQSGYICVKGKRNAEIATIAYDNATHKIGVWLNNRTAEAVTGDIVIAGFKGDKFKSISVKKNVTLTADDFTRLDVEDFDDNGVDEIRVFLVNRGTLTPVNYAKIVTVE